MSLWSLSKSIRNLELYKNSQEDTSFLGSHHYLCIGSFDPSNNKKLKYLRLWNQPTITDSSLDECVLSMQALGVKEYHDVLTIWAVQAHKHAHIFFVIVNHDIFLINYFLVKLFCDVKERTIIKKRYCISTVYLNPSWRIIQ